MMMMMMMMMKLDGRVGGVNWALNAVERRAIIRHHHLVRLLSGA